MGTRDVTSIERDPEPELERTVLVVQLAPPPVYYFILATVLIHVQRRDS